MRRHRIGAGLAAAIAATLLSISTAPIATAGDASVWPVEGERRLLGKLKDGEVKKAKDISGIACMEAAGLPRHCLIIDDERTEAQIVVVDEGKLTAGDSLRLIDSPISLDGEGVAFADGNFYVIGSHGHPRDKKHALDDIADRAEIDAAIAASSHLVLIPTKPGQIRDDGSASPPLSVGAVRSLEPDLRLLPQLVPFIDRRLDANGLNFEGVAVKDGTIFAGLRGPLLDGPQPAQIMKVPLGMASATPSLVALDIGAGRGVRDLAVWGGGLLVLAGPRDDPPETSPVADGDYALFHWNGTTLERLGDIDGFSDDGDAIKPEAILPLDISDGKLRVLVFFDGARQGGARPILFKTP